MLEIILIIYTDRLRKILFQLAHNLKILDNRCILNLKQGVEVNEKNSEIQKYCCFSAAYSIAVGFTGQEHTEIEAIISKNEFAELMEFIDREDLHTFITAGNVSEVYGNWTKKKKRLKF